MLAYPSCQRARHLALLCLAFVISGCYRGDERDKQPPPGYAGGFCLAMQPPLNPTPWCRDGSLCNFDEGYCFFQQDPCEGFFCGGDDRGICMPTSGLPRCSCFIGYANDKYPLYCCPDPGQGNVEIDPFCLQALDVDPDAELDAELEGELEGGRAGSHVAVPMADLGRRADARP